MAEFCTSDDELSPPQEHIEHIEQPEPEPEFGSTLDTPEIPEIPGFPSPEPETRPLLGLGREAQNDYFLPNFDVHNEQLEAQAPPKPAGKDQCTFPPRPPPLAFPPIPYPNPDPDPPPGPEPDPLPEPSPFPFEHDNLRPRVQVEKRHLAQPRFNVGPGTNSSGFSISSKSQTSFKAISLTSQLPSPIVSTPAVAEARRIQLNLKWKDPEASKKVRTRGDTIEEEDNPATDGTPNESIPGYEQGERAGDASSSEGGDKPSSGKHVEGSNEPKPDLNQSGSSVPDVGSQATEEPSPAHPEHSDPCQDDEHIHSQEDGQHPIQDPELRESDDLAGEGRHDQISHEGGSGPDVVAAIEVETTERWEESNVDSQQGVKTTDSSSESGPEHDPDPPELARRKAIREGKRPVRHISECDSEPETGQQLSAQHDVPDPTSDVTHTEQQVANAQSPEPTSDNQTDTGQQVPTQADEPVPGADNEADTRQQVSTEAHDTGAHEPHAHGPQATPDSQANTEQQVSTRAHEALQSENNEADPGEQASTEAHDNAVHEHQAAPDNETNARQQVTPEGNESGQTAAAEQPVSDSIPTTDSGPAGSLARRLLYIMLDQPLINGTPSPPPSPPPPPRSRSNSVHESINSSQSRGCCWSCETYPWTWVLGLVVWILLALWWLILHFPSGFNLFFMRGGGNNTTLGL
ncbi:hypothetical protein BJX70DRAFT_252571 [Aspergillus crustosus]